MEDYTGQSLSNHSAMVDSKSKMVAAPMELSASRDWTHGRGQRAGAGMGRGLEGAGPGAGLSLLVKRQQRSPRRRERGATCPPARQTR